MVEIKCSDCKRQLNWRKGKFGWFLSCTGYPDCRFAFTPYKDQKQTVNCPKCGETLNYIEETDIPYLKCSSCDFKLEVKIDKLPKCPQCGGRLIKRSGKENLFLGCSNYPECRFSFDFGREEINLKCPDCGKLMSIREGKYGSFASCSGFPDCNYVFNL
jgi:DNA topoisomerase-1